MYLSGIGLAISYGLHDYLFCLISTCTTIFFSLLGGIIAGYRSPQFVFLLGFIIIFIFMMCNIFSFIVLAVYLLFLSFSIITTFLFGEGNLDRVIMTGPFQVGY